MLRVSSHYLSWELASTLKESIPKFQSAGVKLIAIGIGAPKKAQIFVERLWSGQNKLLVTTIRREIEFKKAGYNIELSSPLDNIPFSTSPERERIEESVFRNKLTFFAAAKVSSSFPSPDLPEIAFAVRSNVGKSYLLNSLTRQWGVARTSDKPGLTQTINFFNLGSKLCLVDLPGYGFAYAREEVKESCHHYFAMAMALNKNKQWRMEPNGYSRNPTPFTLDSN
ncbi:hypothetical protein L2E82_28273 [Cichorium intybus]|uniref:Uncharacterized protein n=1 Tax=Cichorium intybus TaxID=13427 RepID=A0ACB9CVH1_CICIN|nr:hypothetical protein L2E82_28273 [Cichorium intybus]